MGRSDQVAVAYALAFLLMGCIGYVLGVAHEKLERRKYNKQLETVTISLISFLEDAMRLLEDGAAFARDTDDPVLNAWADRVSDFE